MGFWLYCTAMCLLVPAVMLYFGWRFLNRPPQKINALHGYRTSRSMKNQQTWDYAHQVCGKLWFWPFCPDWAKIRKHWEYGLWAWFWSRLW